METNMDLCNIANDINNEVKDILTKYLSPYLMQMNQDRSNMKCIENILRGMPEFQRLEKENIELRRQLGGKEPAFACVPDVPVLVSVVPVSVVPVPAIVAPVPAIVAPVPAIVAPVPESTIRCIKLDIIETTIIDDNIPNELELYKAVDLLHIVNNEENEKDVDDYETEEEASEAEEEASEAEEEASEAEEEASEAEEEEASEAEQEEAASEAEQEEAASEAEQEEAASEAEEEAASEAEEEAASEAEEEAAEDEEVSLIVINGLRYYTSNETNGDIYKVEGTDDVGDQVGKFVNKVATFF